MALLDLNHLLSQYVTHAGILGPQGQTAPPAEAAKPQGLLQAPGMSQALLALGSTIAQANERGYGLGSGLAMGAQAFGSTLQTQKDRIAEAEKQATQDRLAAMKDVIGMKINQEELGIRMQESAMRRQAIQQTQAQAARQRQQEQMQAQAILASGDPNLIKAYEMFGGDAAQSQYLNSIKPKERQIVQQNGVQYYVDTGEPVLSNPVASVDPKSLVPGLQVAPGAAPTEADATAIKTIKQSYTQLQTLLPQYRQLVEEYGSEIEGSGAANLIQQKQAQIALQVKNLEELGALVEADRDIINDMLGSPVRKDKAFSIESPIRGLPLVGDKARALKQVEGFDQYVNDRYNTALQTRGYQAQQMQAKRPDASKAFQTKSGIQFEVLE